MNNENLQVLSYHRIRNLEERIDALQSELKDVRAENNILRSVVEIINVACDAYAGCKKKDTNKNVQVADNIS